MKKKAKHKAKTLSPKAILEKEKVGLLGRADLFSRLDKAELAIIARYSGFCSFEAEEVIFREGSHAEELYLIQKGAVLIRKRAEGGEEQDIARFLEGEVFAEMDLLDSSPRTASAIAESAATLLVFPSHGVRFPDILEHHSTVFARILYKLLGVIAGRIRATDRLISEKTPWIQEMKRQLQRDKLTNLYNRTYLEEELPSILGNHPQTSLLVLKPDNFKEVNDTYGHEVGDKALIALAHAVKSFLKEKDIGVRFRGDEFCVVLPGRGLSEATRSAQGMLDMVKGLDIGGIIGGQPLSLTASIGVASFPSQSSDARSMIAQAFEGMLEARNGGGNRICGEPG